MGFLKFSSNPELDKYTVFLHEKKYSVMSDEYETWLLGAVPDLNVPEKHRQNAALIIESAYQIKGRRHKIYNTAITVGAAEWRALFSHDDAVVNVVKKALFVDVKKLPSSQKNKYTIGYELKPEVRDQITANLINLATSASIKRQYKFDDIINNRDITNNGTGNRLKLRNKQAFANNNILVRVNQSSIDSYIPVVEQWCKFFRNNGPRPQRLTNRVQEIYKEKSDAGKGNLKKPDNDFLLCSEIRSPEQRMVLWLEQDLMSLLALRDQANNPKHIGFIPHTIKSCKTGRIQTTGGTPRRSRIGLTTCSRLSRDIALSGCFQYDVIAFNHTVAMQIAQRNGLPFKQLLQYVRHKRKKREALAKRVGSSASIIKQALTALMYGATMPELGIAYEFERRGVMENRAKTPFDLVNLLGADKYGLFISDPFVCELARELGVVFHYMVSKARPKDGDNTYTNAAGVVTNWPTKQNQERKVVANLFQGIEVAAIRAVESSMDSVMLTLYDCVFTQRLENKKQAEVAMEKATGFKLYLDDETPSLE